MILKKVTTQLYTDQYYMLYFRSGTKRKRLHDSVKAKKGNREKQEPKHPKKL